MMCRYSEVAGPPYACRKSAAGLVTAVAKDTVRGNAPLSRSRSPAIASSNAVLSSAASATMIVPAERRPALAASCSRTSPAPGLSGVHHGIAKEM
jgi:hypothetical protein